MGEVRWSRNALRDIRAIGEYLERSSPQYARSVVARLYASTETLVDFPSLGREVPEVEVSHIRELIREGDRLIYVETGSGVEVLAVLHSRQDMGRKLRRD